MMCRRFVQALALCMLSTVILHVFLVSSDFFQNLLFQNFPFMNSVQYDKLFHQISLETLTKYFNEHV